MITSKLGDTYKHSGKVARHLGNVTLTDVDAEELARELIATTYESSPGFTAVFPVNVDIFVQCLRDQNLAQLVNQAAYCPCDGMPLLWVSRWLGNALTNRITGIDLVSSMVFRSTGPKTFLLGALPGVAREASAIVNSKYPGRIVGFYAPTPQELTTRANSLEIIKTVKSSGAKCVVVGLGFPKQEQWIMQYKDELSGLVVIAAGATIDFLSGRSKRAPLWLQRKGLEWAYRLVHEPRRLWKRYLINDPWLFWWVVKEKWKQIR